MCTAVCCERHLIVCNLNSVHFISHVNKQANKKEIFTSKHRLHFVEFRFTGVQVNFQCFVSMKQLFFFQTRWVNPKSNQTHATDMVQMNDTMAQCEPSSIKYTLSSFNSGTCCCIKLSNDKDTFCFFSAFFYTVFLSGM